MRIRNLIFSIICMFAASACQKEMHLITDTNYLAKVDSQFQRQKMLAVNRDSALFNVFKQSLSPFETEALKFLFAYMPLSDLADYDGAFYLKNIKSSAQAKLTMPWADKIPENIYRHFVLPIRVNTETLDTARLVFYQALKDRVAGLSMEAAVLEVNHWCHEKVIYRSTDDRTSSPLNCVKSTFGRCGEESTLLVTALRSVGIPARQCYTPRWAHCDDNHAWVEAWVDGEWKYLGACEPEAELNKGWFTGPSKRAMLVNTTVFGDYQGPEDVLEKTPWYTKINVLSNYTKTKKIVVQVVDEQNYAIENANVAFKLYNYAEFYSLSNQLTDKNGFCDFETGLGDLLIWVSKGEAYSYQKMTVANTDTLVLSMATKPVFISTPFTPPADTYHEAKSAHPNHAKLAQRIKQEDSLRANQIATFPDSAQITKWAINNNLPVEQSVRFITLSSGNYQTIQAFLLSYSKHQDWKFELLNLISEKDLRDISLLTLLDHLNNSQSLTVLNPRIANEMSSAYKSYFQQHFDAQFQQKAKADISFLVQWFQQNIQIEKQANYYHIPMSPIGVAELKHADLPSRNILFVAMCRSFGIPARIEPEYAQLQVKSNAQPNWQTINFEQTSKEIAANARLKLVYQNPSAIKLQYGLNFSIAKIVNGLAQTINFDNNPIFSQFPATLSLSPGNYIVITGYRLSDGTVCSNIYPVTLVANQLAILPFEMFIPKVQNKMLGSIDATHQVEFNHQNKSIASFKNTNGLAILCLDLPAEPSKHVIVELQSLKQQWQAMQFPLLVLLPQESKLLEIKQKYLPFFPENTSFAVDTRFSVHRSLKMVKSKTNAPLLMLIDTKDQIKFISAGYAIGNIDLMIQSMQSESLCLKNCTK